MTTLFSTAFGEKKPQARPRKRRVHPPYVSEAELVPRYVMIHAGVAREESYPIPESRCYRMGTNESLAHAKERVIKSGIPVYRG